MDTAVSSHTAGSKVDEIYITDWIALENIVAHGDFDRKYLEKMIDDVCETKSDSECLEPCAIYEKYMKKKCVSKSRIKKFNDLKEITGKNGKLYKIIDAKKYDIETVNPEFYFMFESRESNIYIIFSMIVEAIIIIILIIIYYIGNRQYKSWCK